MVLAQALALCLAIREKAFFEVNRIVSPDISFIPATAYFFGVVLLLALVLFFIPLHRLRLVFRVLFALVFGWGVFIVLALSLPLPAAYLLAAAAGITWLFWARIWLHDLLLMVTLAGAGAVAGFLFTPLTFLVFMLIIAAYDIAAVSSGLMVWMADKMSQSDTLPAFIFPRKMADWKLSLQQVRVGELSREESSRREYTVLGGGDIGFPLMLAVSVFFETGLAAAVLVGVFALFGLMGAFLAQLLWFRNRPLPALPPIAAASGIGFLLAGLFFR